MAQISASEVSHLGVKIRGETKETAVLLQWHQPQRTWQGGPVQVGTATPFPFGSSQGSFLLGKKQLGECSCWISYSCSPDPLPHPYPLSPLPPAD